MSTRRNSQTRKHMINQYRQSGGLVSSGFWNYDQPQSQSLGLVVDNEGDIGELRYRPSHYEDTIDEYLNMWGPYQDVWEQYQTFPVRGIFDQPDYINIYSRELLLLNYFLQALQQEVGTERLQLEVEKVLGKCQGQCDCSKEKQLLDKLKTEILNIISSSGNQEEIKARIAATKAKVEQQRSSAIGQAVQSTPEPQDLVGLLAKLVELLNLENSITLQTSTKPRAASLPTASKPAWLL